MTTPTCHFAQAHPRAAPVARGFDDPASASVARAHSRRHSRQGWPWRTPPARPLFTAAAGRRRRNDYLPPEVPSGGTAKRAQGNPQSRFAISLEPVAPDQHQAVGAGNPRSSSSSVNARPTRWKTWYGLPVSANHRNPLPTGQSRWAARVRNPDTGSPRTAGRLKWTMRQACI